MCMLAAGGATVTASETERAMKLRMSCCNSAGQRPAVPFTPNEPKVQPNGVCGPASCERCAHTHPYYVCSCGSCCAAALYRIVEKGDWQKLQARFANSAVRQRRAPEPGRKPRRREPQGLRHRVSRCRCANDASRLPTLYDSRLTHLAQSNPLSLPPPQSALLTRPHTCRTWNIVDVWKSPECVALLFPSTKPEKDQEENDPKKFSLGH